MENFKEEAVLVENAVNALLTTAMEFAKLMKVNPYVRVIAASDF